MAITKKLTKGSILSETSFFIVKEVKKNEVLVTDEHGNDVTVSNIYVDNVLKSADAFDKTEELNKTSLADLLLNNPRTAMTVAFIKASSEKSAKAYKAEKEAAIAKIKSAGLGQIEGLLNDLIENPITKTIPGELRVIKGRHNGEQDQAGRVHFVDMEQAKGTGTYDTRLRQVDPRTIQYIILDNVKYILK